MARRTASFYEEISDDALASYIRRIVRIPVPVIPLTIHGAGVWAGLLKLGKQEGYAAQYHYYAAWVVPVIMALVYFTIEWQLGRRLDARTWATVCLGELRWQGIGGQRYARGTNLSPRLLSPPYCFLVLDSCPPR